MKKQRFFMLGIITVLVAVLSLTFVSSTFAKYTSTVSGNDTATVAKWGWEYNGTALSATPAALTFDLLQTRYDSNGTDEETDVKTGLIAPGTQGKFELVFKNTSEVNANYTVDFTVNEAGVPLQWKLNDGEWADDLADITSAVAVAMETGESTVVVQWRWAFNSGDDEHDTDLGFTTPDISVSVNVVFTQID